MTVSSLLMRLNRTYSIVDVHSHVGVESAPALDGAADGNSLKGTIQAWLRSIDGLNTHDESFALAVAGGVSRASRCVSS